MRRDIYVFIFRRDLRYEDNLALNALLKKSKETGIKILPIFIFNPKQIDTNQNAYYSKNCCEFMVQSLVSLNLSFKNALCYFHGNDIDVLQKIITHYEIDTIAYNKDYTPFAKQRDTKLEEWCVKNSISTIVKEDYSFLPMNTILSGENKNYEVFTPYYNKFLIKSKDILKPEIINNISTLLYYDKSKLKQYIIKDIGIYYGNDANQNLYVKGGRDNALRLLHRIRIGTYKNYIKERDLPYKDKTTKLSAYIKFGCISIREMYDVIRRKHGVKSELLRQLIWREFYANIIYNNPEHIKNEAYKEKIVNMQYYIKWCDGKTGFPIVDAAMRQLRKEGYLNNRLRMIIASFLVKDLNVYWTHGERFYATQAVDYDPCSNNGGWRSMNDQVYFRIMNPWLQSHKFDIDAKYIKKWIPELGDVSADDIHNWHTAYNKHTLIKYPKPIVDHREQMKLFSDHKTKF